MNYYVHDEDGKMIRCFRWRYEAVRFLQDGWTIRKAAKRNFYNEVFLTVGESLI